MVAVFVIGTIVVSIFIEYLLQRSKRRNMGVTAEKSRAVSTDKFLIPRGYFFNRGHSWIEVLISGKARVGIDDFAQKIVGKISSIDVPSVGSEVRQGETLLTIKQENRTLSFKAPVSGRIVETNTALLKSPSLIKNDPYFDGWVALIDPENIASEIKLLTVADEAAEWLRHELRRFREFITSTSTTDGALVGITLHDGGIPMHGVLECADQKTWESFQQQFLSDIKHK